MIVAGVVLLRLPGVAAAEPLTWLDCFFTSTSAVCVTGLSVRSTQHDFSFLGQLIILLLIQMGGLGFITLSSSLLMQIRHKVAISQAVYLRDTLGASTGDNLGRLLLRCMRIVFFCEALGAALLFVPFSLRVPPGQGWLRNVPRAAWDAIFHSISAFCNAGFSTWDSSLAEFVGDPWVNAVTCALIVLGGLGFFVLTDVEAWWRTRRAERRYRLPFQTHVVLRTSITLIVVGAALIWIGEHTNAATVGTTSWWTQGMAAVFQSVTARTAGFFTIDLAKCSSFSLAVLIILMFIGGSPGSAAGGVKTTTAAVLFTLAAGALRPGREPSFRHRSFGLVTSRSAVALFFVAALLVVGGTLFLLLVETSGTPMARARGQFVDYAFEATSAFGTVGLSTGVTATLTPAGRMLLIVLMFLGRVGPLGLISATLRGGVRPVIRYPNEDIQVG